ncbi:MAG: sensor histidine kinase [Pseudomonadota bacterium]
MRALLAVILLWATPLFAAETVDLSGAHPAKSGDAPAYAAPGFDDSSWALIPVPLDGDWAGQGGAEGDNVRWTRVRLSLSEAEIPDSPALLLGQTSGGDQVFVNGVEIGGTAAIRADWIQMRTANWSRAWPRLYPFDRSLLETGENVVAIRFSRAVRNNAAILSGPFLLGEHGPMIERFTEANAVASTVSRAMNTAYILLFIGLLAAFAIGFRDRTFITFLGVYITSISGMIYLSPTVQQTGLDLPEYFDVYAQRGRVFGTLILAEFVAAVLRVRPPIWLRVVQISALLVALIFPYDDGGLLTETREARYYFVLFGLLIVTLTAAFWCAAALIRGNPVGAPFCIGILALFAGIGFESLVDRNAALVAFGVGASDIGVTVMLLCMAVVAGMNVRRTQHQLRDAQTNILKAHEQERRRIAHDVHDGVGQWLSTIKLNLQMLRSQQKGEAREGFAEVVDHIDEAISDARRIAHDLSPAMIEREGLAAAMRSHADILSERSDLKVRVTADADINLPAATQGHLYRIYQEALANAIRHGGATEVQAVLATRARKGVMTVRDNGGGFAKPDAQGGLGLSSIRERATLLGGAASITTSKNGGVEVSIEFPLS